MRLTGFDRLRTDITVYPEGDAAPFGGGVKSENVQTDASGFDAGQDFNLRRRISL